MVFLYSQICYIALKRDFELQRSGYRLASREEIERYLTRNGLLLATVKRIVYGSGYVWVKDGYWRSKNFTDQGFILFTDDERIRSQYSVLISDNSYGGEHNTYRTVLAITSIKDGEVTIEPKTMRTMLFVRFPYDERLNHIYHYGTME